MTTTTMTKEAKVARRAGVRAMQAAGYFLPARKRVGNGVGPRAHLIARAVAGCINRRESAEDWVEVE